MISDGEKSAVRLARERVSEVIIGPGAAAARAVSNEEGSMQVSVTSHTETGAPAKAGGKVSGDSF